MFIKHQKGSIKPMTTHLPKLVMGRLKCAFCGKEINQAQALQACAGGNGTYDPSTKP